MGKAAVPPQPRAGRSVRVGAAVRAWNRHRGCGRHAAALQSPIPAPSPRQHGARAQQREANGRSTGREGALGPYILRGQVCTPLLNNCCFQRFWKVLDTWCCPFVNQRRRGPLSGWDLITCTGRGECRVAHESTAPERSSDLERCSIFTGESGNQAEMPQGLVTRVAGIGRGGTIGPSPIHRSHGIGRPHRPPDPTCLGTRSGHGRQTPSRTDSAQRRGMSSFPIMLSGYAIASPTSAPVSSRHGWTRTRGASDYCQALETPST